MKSFTNLSPKTYVTKDASLIRELMNGEVSPGLGVSLAEAVVEAGASTAPHRHMTFDEIYYCLEGEGALFIDRESFPFSAGSFYLIPRGSEHALRAVTRLTLLCICSPGYEHEHTVLS